jgi:predicted RNA-binding Zn-ribbon protein involved in translation (DUF1610 family)
MTDQLSLYARTIAEPETRIDLRCPGCGYVWNVAAVLSGVWWGRGVTPTAIAALCHCPYCHASPPMEPAPPPALATIKWPYCPHCGRSVSLRAAQQDPLCADCRDLEER